MTTTRIATGILLFMGLALDLPATIAQRPGIMRVDLQRHDLSTTAREVVQVRVALAPGVAFDERQNPGVASVPAAATAQADTEIRAFRVDVPDDALADLRRRLLTTRWPDKETVQDRSQGVPLENLQGLAHYWSTEYDWRKVEGRLNALPQFTTSIDGVASRC